MSLQVAFLWHMHQPVYLDPLKGRFIMPWVRLHAVKAYTDMVACLDERPEARATFNLVPSLLRQIQDYLNGATDDFMEISRRDAAQLAPWEQEFLLTHFFSCHWPTMVEPYRRYDELLNLRGRDFSPPATQAILERFTSQDFLDLQVWFNLTWIGYSQKKHPLVAGLKRKGRSFSEEDKNRLLDFHLALLGDLLPRYAGKWASGQIEVSTSPFYHPILPLLIDTDFAQRAMPTMSRPERRFAYPEDARAQLAQGRALCQSIFDRAPTGLWPSEGSVAPELIPIVEQAGFTWAATDEAVLYRSLDEVAPEALYQPYRVEIGDHAVDMVFRHHELSDLIGFVYQKNDPQVAVSDFVTRLTEIESRLRNMGRPPFVAVILDGENPWEYYPDGGEAFLGGLYDRIREEPTLELVTVGQYLAKNPPTQTLRRLHSGSWINGDFGIWIGGEEENRGWSALASARSAIESSQSEVSSEGLNQAKGNIFVAEGSDWFWWYGDKFKTNYALEFDHLFRLYLQQVYKNLGRPVPPELLKPLRRPKAALPAVEPTGFIHPQIDGRLSYYWEWMGSGSLARADEGGAMHRGEAGLAEVAYGFDLDWLYFRIDPVRGEEKKWPQGLGFRLWVKAASGEWNFDFQGEEHAGGVGSIQVFKDAKPVQAEGAGIRSAVDELAEVAIPFVALDVAERDGLTFFVEVLRHGLVEDRWPREGFVVVQVPDEDFERKHWMI